MIWFYIVLFVLTVIFPGILYNPSLPLSKPRTVDISTVKKRFLCRSCLKSYFFRNSDYGRTHFCHLNSHGPFCTQVFPSCPASNCASRCQVLSAQDPVVHPVSNKTHWVHSILLPFHLPQYGSDLGQVSTPEKTHTTSISPKEAPLPTISHCSCASFFSLVT